MGESPEGQQCLFCLEESIPDNILIQITYQPYYTVQTCTCRITAHTACYIQYSQYKGRTECPICHRVYVSEEPTPPQGYIIVENRVYQHQLPHPIQMVVSPDTPRPVCQPRSSRTIQILLFIIMIIMCSIILFLRK